MRRRTLGRSSGWLIARLAATRETRNFFASPVTVNPRLINSSFTRIAKFSCAAAPFGLHLLIDSCRFNNRLE